MFTPEKFSQIMKTTLRVHILVAIAAFISSHAIAQTSTLGGVLSTPTIFQKIKVTEEALFQRKVTFDNGLLLDGDARFQNDIVGDGALNIAKSVRFSGLPENPTINYIITGDVSGDLGRAPLTVLARELESTLKNLNELTVKDATTLKGQLTLGDGLQINGAANFANDVLVHGNLAVTGGVKLNLPPALDEVPMGNTVLTYDPSSNSIVPVTGKVLGTPFGPELACPETQLPATWERGVNKLVTDRCSKDIKVGIGLQSPSEMLHVDGNGRFSGGVFAGRKTGVNGVSNEFMRNMLVGGTPSSLNNNYLEMGYDGSHVYLDAKTPSSDGLLINYNNGANVTIGKLASKLIVNGNILVRGNEGFGSIGHAATLNLGNQDHYIHAIFDKGISLSTANTADGLVLDQNGRVGINTGFDNIGAKLHINAKTGEDAFLISLPSGKSFMVDDIGKTYATEVNVVLANAFPDYVFKKDYQLMSITELDNYIQNNGHLPGMPTADEVAKNGIDLGELVRKLVEKNEELVLLLIDMEKKFKVLEQKITDNK